MTRKKTTRKQAHKGESLTEQPQEAVVSRRPVQPVASLPFKTETKPPAAMPADGTLLRKDGDPVVYVMDGGQRRPFADAETFLAFNSGWSGITVLPAEEIDPIPVGEEVASASDLQSQEERA